MLPSVPTLWYGLAVLAQRVVAVRPPPGTLRRGWVAAPPGPTTAVLALAAVVLLALALHVRLRLRRNARNTRR